MDVQQPRTLKLNTSAGGWFLPSAGPSPTPPPVVESSGRLGRQLFDASQRAGTVAELVESLTRAVQEFSDCLGLWLAPKRNAENILPEFKSLLDAGENQLWEATKEQFHELAGRAQETGELQVARVAGSSRRVLVVVPLRAGSKGDELIAGCFEQPLQNEAGTATPLAAAKRATVSPALLLLLVAQAIGYWRKRRAAESLNQINLTFSQTFQALQAVSLSTDRGDAAIAVVNHLRQLLDARQAVLASPGRGESWRIEAVSDVDAIESQSEHTQRIRECFAPFTSATGLVSASNAEPRQAESLDAYRRLAGTEEAIFLPLLADGQLVGGALVGMSAAQIEARGFADLAGFSGAQLGPVWGLVRRASHAWYRQMLRTLVKRCPAGLLKYAWLAAAGVLALLFCPVPHRISCQNELHPVQRRFLAAPFEGVLETVLVRSGDLVEREQLLARMDGSPLQMERSGLEAQLAAALKKRDSALAGGNIAESQIARSEARRCEAQLALVDSKLARLELRSPMAGVIVSGDLDKVEGARFEMGKSLFEVAPLEKMLVELQVPEVDARHVQAGQIARMKFSAYPFRRWEGVVARVHPRSELVGEANVFIAEVELENADGTLRPGMKGWGQVAAGWQPLGWVWLHHAWERLRYVFVW